MREMWNNLWNVGQYFKWGCEEKGPTGMFLNGVLAHWQKYLYCCLSGTVMVTNESQWYSNETHSDQGPGISQNLNF